MDIPNPLRFEDDSEVVQLPEPRFETEEDAIDLITDTILTCEEMGIDFETVLRIARDHADHESKGGIW